ncbi:PAS domain-containing sensor histidine kinase [Erythrobacter neustonensis]|uniref:PAS domain-containing sensor histidine kinase n=1 Tax=Erythrobacter neustonensis TaxID=1112 RepID=UPI0018D43A46|nr:PAS domain-containing sensor histidine kinase [Erythrobacter neustonensis]
MQSRKAMANARRRMRAGSPPGATPAGFSLPLVLAVSLRRLARHGIAAGPLDRSSLIAAGVGGIAYFALACISLALSQAGQDISPIWLSNAVAVAVLLRVRLRNELPFLAACLAGSLAVNAVVQLPDRVAVTYSLANLAEMIAVLVLTRRVGRAPPDMGRLADLARFVWAGGLVGPVLSAAIAAPVMGDTLAAWRVGAMSWFLTDCMANLLIVPTALLVVDRVRGKQQRAPAQPLESAALLVGGMVSAFLVFHQTHYPLLFLIQPVTLLHAFRLGSLGTALNVGGVALVAGAMTFMGQGPIAGAQAGGLAQLHLLQAFVAANFLTGLPVAAILAGRDRMLARLATGKREIDLLADTISDAILRYDMAGICTYASPSCQDVMGAPPAAYLGRHAAARLHPDAQERVEQAIARLLGGTSERERVTYRRLADSPDGAPVFLEADCTVVRAPGSGLVEGVVVAARDVTERVELELLLTRARRHAENAARAKSEFLANMSHEIRTPMNGVLGFAELMLQGDLADDQRRFAELIVQSGRSMMMLLNDVLDLSKIESGQFAIDRAPVDLHASLAECAALHRPAALRKGVALDLTCDCADGSECECAARAVWVMTDGLRLRQIMLNLIGNAVKFTEAGQIRVSYRVTDEELRVTVADSGIGISPLQLETIFHPFTQGEGDIARRFGGTGLGLSISRQLAGLLGGRIEVESTPGEGSRFALVLPCATAPQVPVPRLPATGTAPLATPLATAPTAPTLAAPLDPARILLVEDHDINRLLMTEMLERCGQEVDVAHDGNEAIAMVIDQVMRGRPYDLVLMDVQMPECDGLAATRAIRAEGIGPGLMPIIALTANAYAEDVASARLAGMQAHLAKPIDFARLVRVLQRWLPTRIVEDEASGGALSPPPRAALPAAARATALAASPQLIARWQARRAETVAAVETALAGGLLGAARMDGRDGEPPQDSLAFMLHKLAGTAAMFAEPALGSAAAALGHALVQGEDAARCTALARALLDQARSSGTAPAAATTTPR